jgi:uncharacterized protein YjeT (DUF2065 family)
MIDPSCPGASWFLWIAPSLFLLLYGLPLLLAPFAWARAFRWATNERDDLARYFGRCLGAVAIAICLACLRAAPHPRANAILFQLIAGAGFLLTIVHVWGAVERRQPWTETAEIALYAALTAVSLWLAP